MAHPARYDEGDPFLRRLSAIALELPGAARKVSHGRPVFYTKKIFAVFGGTVKGDHEGDAYNQSVLVLPDAMEREALLTEDRFFVPAYYGAGGWVGLDFRAGEPDWDEVSELVATSFCNTAPASLVRELQLRG